MYVVYIYHAHMSCGEVGSDVHTIIKELAIKRAKHSSVLYSDELRNLAEGTEIVRLTQRFSFVLQQVRMKLRERR